MDTPNKQIPPERKAMYYAGLALLAIGFLLFLSTFVTFLANFGDFTDFDGQARSMGFRAFGGMGLMIFGSFLTNVGARGWAGSGVVLDPEKARKDVEPWNRMGGGMLNDVLSEVNVVKKLEGSLGPQEPQVKVRCRQCQALNDEKARYCNQCGGAV